MRAMIERDTETERERERERASHTHRHTYTDTHTYTVSLSHDLCILNPFLDVPHIHTQHAQLSVIHGSFQINLCAMTHSSVCHDSFICVP